MYHIYLVTDEAACLGRSVEEVVSLAAKGGVGMVQLREKKLPTRLFIERAIKLKQLLVPLNIPLLINDRVDVALASGADGVHVGQDDMPVGMVRELLPKNAIVGLSVENLVQAQEAEDLPIDYLGVSPVFLTPTKGELQTSWGLDGLRALKKTTRPNWSLSEG